MKTLIDLIKSSVLTQALITIAVLSLTGYMMIVGRPVPGELYAMDSLVIGFYFGSKVGIQQGESRLLK